MEYFLKECNLDCRDKTLANAFKRHGHLECKTCQKCYMSPLNISRRQDFCEEHIHKSIDFWKRVVFTDAIHFARNNRSVYRCADKQQKLNIVYGQQLAGILRAL